MWYVDTSLSYKEPDAEKFFETGRFVVAETLDQSPVAPPSNELAVEIGSGLGRICGALAERFARVVEIDISPEMVQRARAMVPGERVSFEVGDGSTLSAIGTGQADLVLTFSVFQHIPKVSVIEHYIEDVGRVLKPGGLFVFQWNNTPGSIRWSLRRALMPVVQRVGISRDYYGRHDPSFLGSRVSLRRIRRALARAQLDLVKTNGLGQLFAFAWAVRQG